MADALFRAIEELQGRAPWGSVLDAGAGTHSLEWVAGLFTPRWTAVTADPGSAERLRRKLGRGMRPADRIVAGNWTDPALLHGDPHDTVLADYLLGALDGFAPYYQDRLFGRLRPLVGRRLYYVGLEPYPDATDDPWGRIVLEIARLRDACILLAGDRAYREYPLDWVLRHLEAAGFAVEDVRSFPIRYGRKFVEEQLAVCRRKLPRLEDRGLARALERTVDDLNDRALSRLATGGATAFGEDHVVLAVPRG